MRKFRSVLGMVPFMILIFGCQFNSQYINREEDKKVAEEVATEFFMLLNEKNYEAASRLFSKEFYKVSTREKLMEIFLASENKLGKLKNLELNQWETKRVEGSNPSSHYQLLYHTYHEKYNAQQALGMVRENDSIKILSYRIDSEAFLK